MSVRTDMPMLYFGNGVKASSFGVVAPRVYVMSMSNEQISELQASLRHWREKANKSQSDVARELDMTRTHMSKVESLKSGVTLDVLERYLKAIGCRLVILPEGDEIEATSAATAQLDPTRRRLIRALLAVLPHVPDVLVDDLEHTVEGWAARFKVPSQ
jgi:transcriptional regulator with XRE-family HTH domain